MPTENRRVATYLPKELDDRLKAFITERNLKGDSAALIVILTEYFGVSQQVAPIVTHFDRFVSKEEFETLSAKVGELIESSSKSDSSSSLLCELSEKIEILEIRLASLEKALPVKEAWSTGDLAKRLNMNNTTLSHWKSSDPKRGKSPSELLKATREKDPDGIGWSVVLETGKFKPERDLPSSSSSVLQGDLLSVKSPNQVSPVAPQGSERSGEG